MAFDTLATVNGIGDCLSSIIVGALWTAFGYSAALFVAASLLVLRLNGGAPPSASFN